MHTGTITECAEIDIEFDSQFGSDRQPLSELARRHLETCERCRKLYQWIQEPAAGIGDSARLQSGIRNSLQNSLTSVAPIWSPRALVTQFAAIFLLLTVSVAVVMGVAGVFHMSRIQLVTITAFLIAGAGLLCRSLAWQMVPGSLHRYSPGMLAALLTVGFLLITAVLFPFREPEAFADRGWHCLKAGLLLAAPASLLFWILVRRGAMLRISALGASLGAAAGLVSVAVLQAACPYQDLAHLLVWHGSVLVLSILAGAGIANGIQRLTARGENRSVTVAAR